MRCGRGSESRNARASLNWRERARCVKSPDTATRSGSICLTVSRSTSTTTGNHDVPLHNVFARFFNPLGGYRHHMTDDLRPHYIDHELVVIGTDTTRSFTIGGGGIRRRELHRIRELLKQANRSAVTVLVAHHPFDEPHAGTAFGRARPGAEAVEQLACDGIDVFLTGHLHVTFAGPTAKRYNVGGRSAIVVEAGTATSTRVRGEPNAFNVLRIEPESIVVEHLVWSAAARAFTRGETQRFQRTSEGWSGVP